MIVTLLILAGAGYGGYYFWSNSNKPEQVKSSINPMDLLVFEVKDDELSDFQKDRAFKMFNDAKNGINENIGKGDLLESDLNYYFWLDVASAQKIIGDYNNAANVWKWFNDAYPANSISPANLGDLYKSFVIDNEQAEYYYKMAIQRDTSDWYTYYSFYEFYRYNLNDSEKAIDILKDGAKNNPDHINYVNELTSYLISLDRKDEAREIIDEYVSRHPESSSLKNKVQ